MLVAFFIILASVAVSGMWVPTYETDMKILVRRQRSDTIVTTSANAPSQLFSDQVSEEDLNSEVELLKSEDLLRKVVQSTGLSGTQGDLTSHESQVRIARAVRKLAADLRVEGLHKSNIIEVEYRSRDPKLAANVLNSLAAVYLEKHLEVHRSSGEFQFFDQQMHQYQDALKQAQDKLIDFTHQTGIVSADSERDSALQQATQFDSTAQQARSSILETRHRIAALQGQLQSMNPRVTTLVRSTDNSQLFENLKSTLLGLELKKTELMAKYAPTYPLVLQVNQQIAETNAAIASEEKKPIREESSDRDPAYEWVKDELARSQSELSGLESRAGSAAQSAAQYHASAEAPRSKRADTA